MRTLLFQRRGETSWSTTNRFTWGFFQTDKTFEQSQKQNEKGFIIFNIDKNISAE